MDEKKLIDLDRLFQSKNPTLYKIIPAFVIRYLKRIIHQDETNAFIEAHYHDNAFQFCEGVLKKVEMTFDVMQLQNVPKTGGCILVCNHPLGALESSCLVTEMQKIRKDIKFIANDLLTNLHNLNDVIVGVNKFGKMSAESFKLINDLFSSDQLILLFPAGLVSRRQSNGEIEDLVWKKTFVSRAKKFNKPVLPVYIHARNSDFFYNLSRFRTLLGIKLNIEMMFLVDEMYKQKGKHITIVFGNLIEPATFTKSKTDEQWAAWVKQLLYNLKEFIK